ncbi:MAG: methyltransferase domain-containing protein [Desulfobacteraceae bacterium]|nr:MAG: methyltransferase domain-containing protein [Desulfobacteraceae bacterium]
MRRVGIFMQSDIQPYRDLYIYMLDGIVPDAEESALGSGFVGNWIEGANSFLFFSVPAGNRVAELLKKRPELRLLDDYHFLYEEWQGGGLDPLRIGPFLILPPWVAADESREEIRIVIDPGVVFGTGLHPTTRDCLRAVARLKEIDGMNRVLDVGTGTGILALAAASLGALEVTGVDANPLCVKTARRNVRLNHLEGRVIMEQGNGEDFIDRPAEIVFANIHYDVIVNMMESPGFRRKEWLVLSGLMRSQARDLKTLFVRHGLRLVEEWECEMTWYTMLVRGH